MGDNVDSGGHGLPFFKTVPDKSPIALNGVQDNWAKVRYEKCEIQAKVRYEKCEKNGKVRYEKC